MVFLDNNNLDVNSSHKRSGNGVQGRQLQVDNHSGFTYTIAMTKPIIAGIWQLGKHRGIKVSDVPSEYLQWICQTARSVSVVRSAWRILHQRQNELRRSVKKKKQAKQRKIAQERRTLSSKHNTHQVQVVAVNKSMHKYELRCIECDAHIQWLSSKDAEMLTKQ